MTAVTDRMGSRPTSPPRRVTRRARPSERVRQPAPLLRTRIPSRRGATEQPNAGGDGEAALTPMFWLALVAASIATGLVAIGLMSLLFHIERLGFGTGDYQAAVLRAGGAHRMTCLLVGGAFGGVAWYLLRRFTHGERSELDDVIWANRGELSVRRSLGTGLISEVVIGLGASLGREAAPKTMGGALGGLAGRWAGLTRAQQRTLIACCGGAGFAAVYDVPLGGAFFTAEILLGSVSLSTMLPALAASWIATLVGWLYLPSGATYPAVPEYRTTASLMVFALAVGVVVGVLASGYIRVIALVSTYRARGVWVIPGVLGALGVLGLIGLRYPQLFGNGQNVAQDAFVGRGGLELLLALAVLKPIVTALCLGGGAAGGLFTPTLSTGAALGAGTGLLWTHLWHGTPTGAFAMVGAAAMIGAAMQAPISGLALVLELTHSGFGIMVPMIAATMIATLAARWIDGYSIYSARLPAHDPPGDEDAPNAGLTY